MIGTLTLIEFDNCFALDEKGYVRCTLRDKFDHLLERILSMRNCRTRSVLVSSDSFLSQKWTISVSDHPSNPTGLDQRLHCRILPTFNVKLLSTRALASNFSHTNLWMADISLLTSELSTLFNVKLLPLINMQISSKQSFRVPINCWQ